MSEITEQISSSIDSLTQEFNIITHNLANVSTVGYKRRCNSFSQSLEAQKAKASGNSSEGTNLNTKLDFSEGDLVQTGRPLDFALHGDGFFLIETPDGPLYSRNGMFNLNPNGQIVDSMGRIVAGQNGPISIPNNVGLNQLHVSSDGNISAGEISIGTFKLVEFNENQDKLIPVGESCFRMTDENVEPTEAENIIIKQGFQESSNVKIVDELVDMLMVSRIYEANMKFISTQKDSSSSLISAAMG
jgi:flagellar basal-body rod protein FlgF